MRFIDSSSYLKSEFIDNNMPLQQINKLLLSLSRLRSIYLSCFCARFFHLRSKNKAGHVGRMIPRTIQPPFTSSRIALSDAFVSIPLLSILLSFTRHFCELLDRRELDRTSSAQRFFRSRLEFAKRNADRLPVTINHLLQLSILDCEGYRTGSVQDGIRYKEQQQ